MLFTDQLNREVEIKLFPQKIISLVPSQTEFLADLGLENQIAGITKFCIHPTSLFKNKPHIGGTKQIDFEKINALKPDLIIGNKEENNKDQIEKLIKQYHYPVWISDVRTLDHAFAMMEKIGEITGKKTEAEELVTNIKSGFNLLEQKQHQALEKNPKTAIYLIWQNPYMSVNNDTFIGYMMGIAGFENIFGLEKSRYPEIKLHDIIEKKPDYLLLSSEPFPFNEKHQRMLNKELPDTKIILVDGELFSWYGSRLNQTPDYLGQLKNL